MNVFMPESDVISSLKTLDDRRLRKQILECRQIIAINDKIKNGASRVSYANHPVVKFYRDKRAFLVYYGFYATIEYCHRFGKDHKYSEWFWI